jgi:hypothetical protein
MATLQILIAQYIFRDLVIPLPLHMLNQNPTGMLDIPIILRLAQGWGGAVDGASSQMEISVLRQQLYRSMAD